MNSRIHGASDLLDHPNLASNAVIQGSKNRPPVPVTPYVVTPGAGNTTAPSVIIRSVNSPVSPNVSGMKVTSVIHHPSPLIRQVVHPATLKPLVVHPALVKNSSTPAATKSESTSSVSSTSTVQKNVIREMQVRVPNRRDRRFSVLRFHSSDHPDLGSGVELFMQRENNLKQYRSVNNMADNPERGAGTEFGREAKEEARLRKHGIIRDSYRPDDQPWIMTVGKGKSSRRRFRGVREGTVSENMEYFVFCQCKDGNFDAYPVHAWYKMKPEINYRFLREDEAEIEYNRVHKTMNLFNVMIKRKLADGDGELEDQDHVTADKELGKELRYLSVATDSRASVDKDGTTGATGSRGSVDTSRPTNARRADRLLKLTDLEECDSASDAEEDDEEDETGADEQPIGGGDSSTMDSLKSNSGQQRTAKPRGKAAQKTRLLRKKQRDAKIVSRMRRCVKKRKARKGVKLGGSSSDDDDPLDEARDDSEVDDHEGDEVDYMTNSSSDEEKLSSEEREKIYEETGVDEETGLKALLTDISSEEEEQENREHDERDRHSDLEGDTQDDSNQGGKRAPAGVLDATVRAGPGDQTSSRIARHRAKHAPGGDSPSVSTSSSSSVDDDSSSYSSSSSPSSSSDSEVDPDEKAKKKAKRAALFQKLSSVSTDLGELAGSKRRPTDAPDASSPDSTAVGAPNTKKPKLEPPSVPSTSGDSELINTVRKYLMRKPITVTELLKKIRLRKLVGRNEDAQTALANVLRQLRPIKQIINGQHALSLKH